ncbi:chemotaxis protein [Yersinia intermedia]|uniref:chemotaxis protein n=1 Tax=Yersinia intermedia TaxID=631 RepID=UPI000B4195F5|nr:chemotaxis protein [Yersinia intermedia]OVZ74975.1 chemotaxis protein [Yersinia intermedia]
MVANTDVNKSDNTSSYVDRPSNNEFDFSILEKKRNGLNNINSSVSNSLGEHADIFSMGLSAFYEYLDVLESLARSAYDAMHARSKYANDIQGNANQVDSVIAEAAKGDDKTTKPLPDSVIEFMREHGIKVDKMSIDEYLKKNGPTLDKGQLQAVKAGLDNEKTRASDTMTQEQLQLQKFMQSYNVNVNNISTLQTGLKDILTTIARNLC